MTGISMIAARIRRTRFMSSVLVWSIACALLVGCQGPPASEDNGSARLTLERYEQRLARALASVINLLDPHVIVLGGGLSRLERLYETVPQHWGRWVFSDRVDTRLTPPVHGDSSGVLGAARLWDNPGE